MIQCNKDTDGIAVLTINMPDHPVNVINAEFISAFEKQIHQAIADTTVKGIIITSGKKDFIVGADLKLIFSVQSSLSFFPLQRGAGEIYVGAGQVGEALMPLVLRQHRVLRKMETSGKPVVAAINGTALGGGFEICLACHHRIAVSAHSKGGASVLDGAVDCQIGLPEVQLGLLPGGGGTQRLPRIIGIRESLSLLLEGKKLRPEQALKAGLIDAIVNTQEELIPAAKEYLKKIGKSVQTWDENGYKIPGGGVQRPDNVTTLSAASALIVKKTHGNYPAPLAIMNCIYEGIQLPFDKAIIVESRYFIQCVLSVESKNMLRTLFFNMNEANKGASPVSSTLQSGAGGIDVGGDKAMKVGILGAGMMGAGIAYVSASSGLDVVLKDVTKEAAEKGKNHSAKLLEEKLSKNYITKEKGEKILNRIQTTADAKSLAGCDLIIEAVFENRELKASVTKESESVMSANAIFASNTSTLPITSLAKASSRPQNFIGIHFFSPVEKMQLVEIIVGKKTSAHTIAMAIEYVRHIKKTPIVVNDGRGFYTSRIFSTYLFEGFAMLAEGISPALIENAGMAAGMPIGPLAVADEVSIELCYRINKQTEADTGKKREDAAIGVVNKFIEEFNRPGKKAGKGFYEYPPTGGKKYLWTELLQHFSLIEKQPDEAEVIKRLLHIQALEAAKCLEENIVTKPADADIGSVLGWGFPAYTGGVLSYIDMIGVKKFCEECKSLAKKYGKRFSPGSLLKRMATEGKLFYQPDI